MDLREVDNDISLVPYYPNEEIAIEWYQDKEVCRQVDNIDHVYSLDRLRSMYDFLSTHGECFYVRYKGQLIGDISLRDDSEIAIVVCKEYQNRHIGRRCVLNMFQSIGFRPSEEEWYIYDIE